MESAALDELRVNSPEQSLDMIRMVLADNPGPARDILDGDVDIYITCGIARNYNGTICSNETSGVYKIRTCASAFNQTHIASGI